MGRQVVPPVLADLQKLYDGMKSVNVDPVTGVDNPHAVVRMVVLDAMRLFSRLTGRAPRLLYVTPALEAALQVDRGRNLGEHEDKCGRLRKSQRLFNCGVVWDAEEFKVE